MRRSHAESANVQINLARTRVNHSFDKGSNVLNLATHVYGVEISGLKGCVMNLRRERMCDRKSYDTHDARVLINLIDAIEIVEIIRCDLPGCSPACIVSRSISQK